MRQEEFVRLHREQWQDLERLIASGRSNRLGRLTGDDVFRLGHLYRRAASDLARARRDYPDAEITAYLNGLVGRAHPVVYRPPPTALRSVGQFIRRGFPDVYLETLPYIALAFALFFASAAIAAALVTLHSSAASTLLGGDQVRQLTGVMRQHHLWIQSATENHSVAANFIMLNNIQVALIAFAGGMFAGLGTVYVMVQNGVAFGAVAALVAQYRLSAPFWAFVAPHGVIELSVIFIAGGAGLRIGDAILRPGSFRRLEVVPAAARRAILLLLGCVPLLIVAGSFESFFDPSDLPTFLKLTAAALNAIWLYWYLFSSRMPRRRRQDRLAFAQFVHGTSSEDVSGIPPNAYSAERALISR